MPWRDTDSIGIVGGDMGGSWKESGAYGAGDTNISSTIFYIIPMRPRSNDQYGVLSGISGIKVSITVDVYSGGR